MWLGCSWQVGTRTKGLVTALGAGLTLCVPAPATSEQAFGGVGSEDDSPAQLCCSGQVMDHMVAPKLPMPNPWNV